MTDLNSQPPQIQELVLDLQKDCRAIAEGILSVASLVDGRDPFAPGSDSDYAFRSGVEAGMTAMMQALHNRGWIHITAPGAEGP